MGHKKIARWLGVACALCLLFALACGKRRGDATSTARGNAGVPAPPGLIADLVMAHPETTWNAVRGELGSDAALLPKTAALLIITTLGLPAAVADELDLASPIVGAIDARDHDVGAVAAVHLKSGAKVSQLLRAAGYTADAGAGVTAYRPPGTAPGYAVATSGEHLVVASDARALAALAPYATTTLASRPLSKSDVSATIPGTALAGPVAATLRRAWEDWKKGREGDDLAMRQKHGGSAPDFGDPAEALADMSTKVERLVTVVRNLSEVHADVDVDPKSHTVRAALSLATEGPTGPASDELRAMAAGDAEPLLALPRSSVVAVLSRDGAEARARSAKEQSDAIAKVLGGRLGKADQAKVEQAIQSWTEARGDWLAASLVWSKTVRAALLCTSVSEPAKMALVPGKVLELLSIPAIAEPLSNWVGDMHLSPPQTGASGSATVHTVHIVRRPAKVQTKKPRDTDVDDLDVRWSLDRDTLVGALGQGAKSAHAMLLPGATEPKLADDPILAPFVRGFGSNVSFLLVADMRRFASQDAPPDGEAAAAAVAYGRTKGARGTDEGWLRLELPTQQLASLVRVFATPRLH